MNIKKIEIYDPAMCCSTGVCGPSIDSELMRISSTINTLKGRGITIKRFGLSTEPQMFITNEAINALLQSEGADILPVTMVDGEVMKTKSYPTNIELSKWLGIDFEEKFNVIQDCGCGPEGCC